MTSVERAFPALLQEFFHRRLIAQRGASTHTIASYRDTFTLFLGYAAERTGRTPSALTLSDLDAPVVLGFLDHLETERGNSARTLNLRLTAIRSFMRYASLREPSLLPVAQRVLAIPVKRFDRPVLGYLSRDEITAIPHLSHSASPPPTGSSTSWKASDYAEYRSRQMPGSTRAAEPTPHSSELRMASSMRSSA